MYCAEAKPKIAEVVVAVGSRIEKFDEYERATDGRLSGGHLEAQKRRFRRLWRIAFFIERAKKDEWKQNGLLITLQNVIESLVFPKGDLARSIRRSDCDRLSAHAIGRVDGGSFRDLWNALRVDGKGSRGTCRWCHGPRVVIAPVMAMSMAS